MNSRADDSPGPGVHRSYIGLLSALSALKSRSAVAPGLVRATRRLPSPNPG
jgi:hypothetical protein